VLADVVVCIHFTFVLFVVLGGLLVLRWPQVAYAHVPAAFWGVWIEFSGRICPLTPLEHRLRAQAGEEVYSGGFIEHYLLPVLYPASLTRSIQLGLGVVVLVINLVVYVYALRRRRAPLPS
jgi:Protein of Unknown function (DUF2784)